MTDVAALAYLELRIAVNKLRRIFREPVRLLFWIFFLLWFGSFVVMRSWSPPGTPYGISLPRQAGALYFFVPAGYLALLGMQILSACRRAPATFAYPADAHFLFGSPLPHRLVVTWLQLREASFSASRFFLVVFVISWNMAGSLASLVIATTALLTAYFISFGIKLPVFLAHRRYPKLPLRLIGICCVLGGAVTLAYPVGLAVAENNLRLTFIAAHALSFPPGSWIVHALHGDLSSLTLLCVIALGVILLGSNAASDAYPELWEASSRLYALRALAASGRAFLNRDAWRKLYESDPSRKIIRIETARSASGERAPSGALSILWKEWLGMRRGTGGLRWPIFWLIGATILGYGVGLAAADFSAFVLLGPLIGAGQLLIVIGSQTSVSLATELRKPIWWMGSARLRERVSVWTIATLMRLAPALILGVFAAGVALRSRFIMWSALPVIFVFLLLIQSIGLAAYVVLPSRNDLRGPGLLLRMFTVYLCLLPPAAAWTITQVLTHSPYLGAAAAITVAVLESWMLLTFAAWRLEANGMEYAAAEQA